MKKSMRVLSYNAVFTPEKDGGFSVYIPELPGCFSEGETFEEAKKNIQEAIVLYLQPDKTMFSFSTDSKDQFMAPVRVELSF